MTTSLQGMMSRLDALRVFPAVAVRVREVAADGRSTMADLERVVSMDPALTARILKVANSPAFGMSARVGSLRQALVLLGFDATRDLAFALAVGGIAERRGVAGRRLWQHSLTTAMLARSLAKASRGVDAQRAFVGGLLHELGMILMLELEPDSYPDVVRGAGHDPALLVRLEEARFGFDHPALGGAAMQHWGLPDDLCTIVADHHASDPERPVPAAVALADGIAYILGARESRAAVIAAATSHPAAAFLGLRDTAIVDAIDVVVGEARSVTREVA